MMLSRNSCTVSIHFTRFAGRHDERYVSDGHERGAEHRSRRRSMSGDRDYSRRDRDYHESNREAGRGWREAQPSCTIYVKV